MVHRERRDRRGVGSEGDESDEVVGALLHELREEALDDGEASPLLELPRGVPEVRARRREVERVHRPRDVDGHRDGDGVDGLLLARERGARTRRGDHERGEPGEEDERGERGELRAPSRRLRGEARRRGKAYSRAPAAPQETPRGDRERQEEEQYPRICESHTHIIPQFRERGAIRPR